MLGSAIVLVVIISISFSNFLGNSSMPNVAVSTGSMLPIYNGFQDTERSDLYPFRGDILLVKSVPVSSLEVGDVIVFDTISISDPVVHRIIAKWQNNSTYYFKTNGDNNIQPDSWIVEGNDVIGLVVVRIPHIGWFLLVLQTDLGKFLVILAAILILFGEDILPILGITRKKTEEKQENKQENNKDGKSDQKSKKHTKFALLRKKGFFYSIIGIFILFTFLTSSLISSVTLDPYFDCYQINDKAHSQSLLDSSPDSIITLSTNYNWMENSQQVYFYPILIEIRSGGIFNNIDRFEIQVNHSEGTYGWNIVYNFAGVRIIEGGIISHVLGPVEISIHLYSRGVLAASIRSYTFNLILET
ncbi:MAG: signal peptidase I [Candidatus Hodarchaeales archaeon]